MHIKSHFFPLVGDVATLKSFEKDCGCSIFSEWWRNSGGHELDCSSNLYGMPISPGEEPGCVPSRPYQASGINQPWNSKGPWNCGKLYERGCLHTTPFASPPPFASQFIPPRAFLKLDFAGICIICFLLSMHSMSAPRSMWQWHMGMRKLWNYLS